MDTTLANSVHRMTLTQGCPQNVKSQDRDETETVNLQDRDETETFQKTSTLQCRSLKHVLVKSVT